MSTLEITILSIGGVLTAAALMVWIHVIHPRWFPREAKGRRAMSRVERRWVLAAGVVLASLGIATAAAALYGLAATLICMAAMDWLLERRRLSLSAG